MMVFLRVFPTLSLPFLLYLFLLTTDHGLASGHPATFLHMATPTGGALTITTADLVGLAIVLCLALDLANAASTDATSIVHLCVDCGLGVLYIVLFLLMPAFATASFLMLTLAATLEFIVGAGITVTSARRDVSYGQH